MLQVRKACQKNTQNALTVAAFFILLARKSLMANVAGVNVGVQFSTGNSIQLQLTTQLKGQHSMSPGLRLRTPKSNPERPLSSGNLWRFTPMRKWAFKTLFADLPKRGIFFWEAAVHHHPGLQLLSRPSQKVYQLVCGGTSTFVALICV